MSRGFIDIADLLLRNGANIRCWYEIECPENSMQYSSTALSEAAGFKPELDSSEETPGQSALTLVRFFARLAWII